MGVVAFVAVLALLTGVTSGVAAEPATAFEEDANVTVSIPDTTDHTLETVETTANGTVSVVGATTGDTADTVGEHADIGTDVGGTDRVLATNERLVDLLGRAEAEALGLARTALAEDADDADSAAADTGPETDALSPRILDRGQATATARDPAVDDLAAGRPTEPAFVAATAGDDGLSATGVDPPGPVSGVAVGLQAVVAGVALRELTELPAPARTAAATGRGLVDRLSRLFAPLRYSRYDDSDPLEHETRAAMFDAIDDSPGVYLTELSEQTGVTLSTLRHHVRVLQREDLVVAATVRGRRRFYPAHTEDVELAAALNDEATAPIVDALARLGAVTVSELADADGRDASTLTHHLQRLEADGLVVRERDGRAIVNRLAPEARDALAPLREADADPAEAEPAASAD